MIKTIVTDEDFLRRPSVPATVADMKITQDLLDTLAAHSEHCIGLAANMIGICKCIIVVMDAGTPLVLYNPVITKSAQAYDADECCLSLSGSRRVKRYRSIKVQYKNSEFQGRIKTFTETTAQIIQHEMDHLRGIII